VADIISYIVPDNTLIISCRYKNSQTDKLFSDDEGDDHVISIPMVVLCNQRTASASEIFTSAIRDYNDMNLLDATIVGTTTYGKGVIQRTYTYVIDKSSYTMTIAYYEPPCGISFHGIGVVPDVEIELEQGEDNQLEGAYSALQELINANNN
jgi:carboxyl-terminal processing protease